MIDPLKLKLYREGWIGQGQFPSINFSLELRTLHKTVKCLDLKAKLF